MQIKDCTQTKDGTPILIYNTKAGGKHPIHGAYWDASSKQWIIGEWTLLGRLHCGIEDHPFNLDLTDWRDEIPWSHIRDDLIFVTREDYLTQMWYAWKCRPENIDGTWRGSAVGDRGLSLQALKMPSGPVDWRQAIAERPSSETKS